jgi:hypothetical protein
MSRNQKKGRYSNKQHPCPICGNTKGSCKQNHDGSIYCYHSPPDSAPSDYLHIQELSGGMGHEFIEPSSVSELLRAAIELQSRGKKATSKEMADLARLPSSWARAVQKAYPSSFPEWNNLSCHRSQVMVASKPEINTKKITLLTEKPPVDMQNTASGRVAHLKENFPGASEQETLSEEERDKQYRKILRQIELNETHRKHLTNERGLGNLIDLIGFRSWRETQDASVNLPGVVERDNNLYLYGQLGLFLPIHNEFGQIIAFQIRPTPAMANINGVRLLLRVETVLTWITGKCH